MNYDPADTADPAPPVRRCALQAAPVQRARPFARHERFTGPFMSGLSPLEGAAEGRRGWASYRATPIRCVLELRKPDALLLELVASTVTLFSTPPLAAPPIS